MLAGVGRQASILLGIGISAIPLQVALTHYSAHTHLQCAHGRERFLIDQAAARARSAEISLKVRHSAAQQVMLARICCLPCEADRCAPAAQTPTWTSGMELQRKLHRPQLLASVCRSTHTPLQHVWLLSHSFPQDPQLRMVSAS